MTAITLEAARTKLAQLENEAAGARAAEAKMKLDAAAEKRPMGDGYWQTRWAAERKVEAARRLVEALEDVPREVT